MRNTDTIAKKIYSLPSLLQQLERERMFGKKVSFTNGCFDILHRGHLSSLSEAAAVADLLIVGVNSDKSTARLKGAGRPVNDEQARALMLASMLIVDAVIIFEEDTPLELIKAVKPDFLVKGGDYSLEQIVGSKEVMEYGGKVIINPLVKGVSTSALIDKINRL